MPWRPMFCCTQVLQHSRINSSHPYGRKGGFWRDWIRGLMSGTSPDLPLIASVETPWYQSTGLTHLRSISFPNNVIFQLRKPNRGACEHPMLGQIFEPPTAVVDTSCSRDFFLCKIPLRQSRSLRPSSNLYAPQSLREIRSEKPPFSSVALVMALRTATTSPPSS